MRTVDTVMRHAVLCMCVALAACATPTRPSVAVAGKSPEPAPISNFQIVSAGGPDGADAVYRSGQPAGEAEWAYLEKIGIRTVVKLNEFSAEVDEAEELGFARKHNINVIRVYMPPEDFPHNWSPFAHPDEKVLMQAVEALENKGNLPALVHCSHGKDRTGLVVALYSVRNKNYCKETALTEMEYYGTSPFLFELEPMLYSPHITQNPGCR